MYRLSHPAFPTDQTVEVLYYRLQTVPEQSLELLPGGQGLKVDFAVMDAQTVACAVAARPEGWTLRGLIAVDAVAFEQALEHAMTATSSRRFGAVLGDDWYVLTAVEEAPLPQAGESLLVGLYR